MVEVVAGIIVEKDKFLICQRPLNKARGLLWEFVGGKVEQGETKERALIRECEEELGIKVTVGEEFLTTTHVYPDITVILSVFLCKTEDEPKLLEHNDLRWITKEEIKNFAFCPADERILEKIEREL